MQDAKIQNLANTLKMTGLASSATDALRMAGTILGTEEKVATDFKKYCSEPPKQTKTYQEEIDELIRKTSPEYKNYHVPVKGYKRDEPKKEVFFELDQPSTGQKLIVKTEPKEEPPEVYTDVFESSQKPLSEMMGVVDQGDVCSNDVSIAPVQEEEPETDKIEFILPEEELPDRPDPVPSLQREKVEVVDMPKEVKEEPKEQLFKEIKENKSQPREIKNPIEKVDLMNYFKVG